MTVTNTYLHHTHPSYGPNLFYCLASQRQGGFDPFFAPKLSLIFVNRGGKRLKFQLSYRRRVKKNLGHVSSSPPQCSQAAISTGYSSLVVLLLKARVVASPSTRASSPSFALASALEVASGRK